MLGKFPDDDASGDGDIHGVLGAELRDFEASVGEVDDALVNALHLVAENHSIF